MAESLPTSVSGFHHRRARADSTASFSFYQDDEEELPLRGSQRLGVDDLDEMPFGDDSDDNDDIEDEEDSADLERQAPENDYVLHRRASIQSRISSRSRLLRNDSTISTGSAYGAGRFGQKIYMTNEDLTIAINAFRTSPIGLAVYFLLCTSTLGLAWLLLRWFPRWQVKLIGKPSSLRDCSWVVIENQWNEMAILDVDSKPYGRPLSTVFGSPRKSSSYGLYEDGDPILEDLRTLNYRYVRLYFHPLADKFLLCNGWKDPLWGDVRALRVGIDLDEKSHRDVVFGSNLIDIEQKSAFRLLVDEVFHPFYVFQVASLILWSLDAYYYYAIAIFVISAGSITTTLIETRAVGGCSVSVAGVQS